MLPASRSLRLPPACRRPRADRPASSAPLVLAVRSRQMDYLTSTYRGQMSRIGPADRMAHRRRASRLLASTLAGSGQGSSSSTSSTTRCSLLSCSKPEATVPRFAAVWDAVHRPPARSGSGQGWRLLLEPCGPSSAISCSRKINKPALSRPFLTEPVAG